MDEKKEATIRFWSLHRVYLGGQGDLVSRLKMGTNGLTILVIGDINLLSKSPLPSK